MMKDLKNRTVRGGLANVCKQAISFALKFGSTAVLARMLSPKEFGLVAMVTVFTGVYNLFTTVGLSSAAVQRATITEEQISTLFWINMLAGIVLATITVLTAPVLVIFYNEPRLLWVTVTLAAGFLFNASGVQHTAILQREMRFVALSVIDIVSTTISITVGITLAFFGLSYWALVAMTVTYPAASTVGKWYTTAWLPGMPCRGAGIRSLLMFGGTITLNNLIVYCAYNLEKVLLGRLWGADALGLYGRAYYLINIPTESLNTTIGVVAFSALSRVQDDIQLLRKYFLKGYSVVISMTVPITICFALFADDFIQVVLGPKWTNAVPIFRLLTPTVLIFGLINPLGWLLTSSGYQKRSLLISLVLAPLVIASYVLGLPYGPTGVAFSYSAVLTIWVVPHVLWCIRGTMISASDILETISRPFISAAVAGGLAYGIHVYFQHYLPSFPLMLLEGSSMAVFYLWMLLQVFGQKDTFLDLFRTLRSSTVDTDAANADT
jgi:PST family polysaccharide transporter